MIRLRPISTISISRIGILRGSNQLVIQVVSIHAHQTAIVISAV